MSSCPQLDLLLVKASRFAFILLNYLNFMWKSQDKSLTTVSLNFRWNSMCQACEVSKLLVSGHNCLFHFFIGHCCCLNTVMWLWYHSLVSCSQAQAEDQQRYLKFILTNVKNTECKFKYFFTSNKQCFRPVFIETVLFF